MNSKQYDLRSKYQVQFESIDGLRYTMYIRGWNFADATENLKAKLKELNISPIKRFANVEEIA